MDDIKFEEEIKKLQKSIENSKKSISTAEKKIIGYREAIKSLQKAGILQKAQPTKKENDILQHSKGCGFSKEETIGR